MLRWLSGLVLLVTGLLLLLQLLILLPPIQQRLKAAVISALEEQLDARASIGGFYLGFPKALKVESVLIEGHAADTLAYVGNFSIDVALVPLLSKKIVVQNITLEHIRGDIGKVIDRLPSEDGQAEAVTPVEVAAAEHDNKNPWTFAIRSLDLNDADLLFRDEDNGIGLALKVGQVHIELGDSDLDSLIHVRSCAVKQTEISLQMFESALVAAADTTPLSFANLALDRLTLEEVSFDFFDSISGMLMSSGTGKLSVTNAFVDITHTTIGVDDVEVENSHCDLVFLPGLQGVEVPDTATSVDDLNWGQYLWRITGNRLAMVQCRYTMNYKGAPAFPGHFDPMHLQILDASGEITGFILDADTLVARINSLQAKEGNGFELNKFSAVISHHDSTLDIGSLEIETPHTRLTLQLKTAISPTDYQGVDHKSAWVSLDVQGDNWLDVDYFYPFLDKFEWIKEGFGSGNFTLFAELEGTMQDMNIGSFVFTMLDSTRVALDGHMVDAGDPEAMRVQLSLAEVQTTRSEIERSIRLGLPDSVFALPAYVSLDGNYAGIGDTHRFTGKISSPNGTIQIPRALVRMGDIPDYMLTLSADLHHLGSLSNRIPDQVSFSLDSELSGNQPEQLTGKLHMTIDSLAYRSFTYRDLVLAAEFEDGRFKSDFESVQPDAMLKLAAHGSFDEDDIHVSLNIQADEVNLGALNFYEEAFSIKTNADLVFGLHPENAMDLTLNLHHLDLDYNDSVYTLHPFDLDFSTSENNSDLSLVSFYYELAFEADDHILDVVESFRELPGYYLADHDTVKFGLPEFRVSGSMLYPRDFVRRFVPGAPEFDQVLVSGDYSRESDKLDLLLQIPNLSAVGVVADSLYLRLDGSSEELDFASGAGLIVEDLLAGSIQIDGTLKDSEGKARLAYYDSYASPYLDVEIQIDTAFESLFLHLLPPQLTFSYDTWEVNPDNKVIIGIDTIVFENVELTNGTQKIAITSFPEKEPNKITLLLTDFGLGSLENLFAMDTLVNGRVNAEIMLSDPLGNPLVGGSLTIDDLALFDIEAGRLQVNQFGYGNDSASAQLTLKGPGQDISLAASWIGADSLNPLSADLMINMLQLSELNYLLEEDVNNAKGILKGALQLSGSPSDPLINGYVAFEDASAGINFLNNTFSLGTESITIRDNIFEFKDFGIVNARSQAAKINGTINMGSARRGYSDLLVKTDNMEIMNSTQKQNDLIFGLLKAQAGIKVKGPVNDIRINANVKVDKSTDITYIFPDQLALDNNKGVVQYGKFEPVIPDDDDLDESRSFFSISSFKHVISKIEIDQGARFNLFFDQGGDNYLDAALSGTINYSMIENNTEVSGMFEVEDGTLRYSIPMVTVEEYTIEPGSFLTLSNDLYNPYLNIVASSRVRASTEGLMTGDPQVMVFKILLYLTGELNDVKLRFDIAQETNDALVSARLAQLSAEERNMNAINLLVRGSFVFSLQGDEIGGTSTMDAQIDRFYTTHLNHLISENVSFVDLRFDVQSFRDMNSQGDTEMQRNYYYNIGKSFFKDRARINYKGSMGLTSDMQAQQVNSSFVQNELEVEVKITKDGVLRGVFFRKNQYEGLLEGEVIETGGGLKLSKDFYSIGDIFTNEKRQQKKLDENAENQKTDEQ